MGNRTSEHKDSKQNKTKNKLNHTSRIIIKTIMKDKIKYLVSTVMLEVSSIKPMN